MILYYFACIEYLDSIKRNGLTRGDVPTKFKGPLFETNAVWFTTDPQPEGHGLGEAKTLTEEDRRAYFEVFGILRHKGSRIPDKKAVRITVVIPSNDRRLVRWLNWGRKHCEPGLYDALAKGNLHTTWWLYLGTVSPNRFCYIDHLHDNALDMRGRSRG
jgi:hypothetical protein